jgi:GH15 family glucan-1,4-alpha-glucosidase
LRASECSTATGPTDTLRALYRLGHAEEAHEHLNWELYRSYADRPSAIQPVRGLHGEVDLAEEELDHLSGYRGSGPVRIGNEAAGQRQLDVFGELLGAVHDSSQRGEPIDEENWNSLRAIVEHTCDVWEQPNEGLWEVRSESRHFTHSKVICWLTIDCGIKLARSSVSALSCALLVQERA